MSFDLLIKNGSAVDGSGMARYRADVGVKNGKIAAVGRLNGISARETIDAEGMVVAPGFIDGHTHMDAQIFWDPMGSCSCYHGVTTVVMGNCGFTLAPCRESEADLVFRNLERAEDINRDAMKTGITWQWESFPQFLDVLDALPKGINYSGYIGHSALRTYVMGERAFSEEATADDLTAMTTQVKEALRAGAMGFSTSRSFAHRTADDRPVASRLAAWSEVEAIVGAMAELNSGIFELAPDRESADHLTPLKELAVKTGRPITLGVVSDRDDPREWQRHFEVMEQAGQEGGMMFAQVHTRGTSVLLSFETSLPFDRLELWRDVRALPLAEQLERLRDPATRARLIEIAAGMDSSIRVIGGEARPPKWDKIYPMLSMAGTKQSMADMAEARGIPPVELMIELAMERGLKLFFMQMVTTSNETELLEMMKHPLAAVTFSDAGAHVSQISDSSLQTYLLSRWVREKQAFTLEEAVRKLTYDISTRWGFTDRGLIRKGLAADIVIFDPATISPGFPELRHDLPSGARRLFQNAIGMKATIVNGSVVLRDGLPTGNLPGRLLRAEVPA